MNQGITALVVDDSLSIREYIRAVLSEELNFERIQLASCADEGIDYLKADNEQNIAWVICDWEMPGSPAIQLFEYVRKHYSSSDIRLLLISGRKDNIAKQLATEAQADSYLSKPFTAGLLLSKVRNLMRQGERRRAARITPRVPYELDIGFDGYERLEASLLNISESGCLVKMPLLSNGYGRVYDIASIKFTFADQSILELDGHIVRIERDKASPEDAPDILIAFEYLYMETDKKEALQAYLRQCLSFVDSDAGSIC